MGELLQPWHLILISGFFGFPAIVIGVIPFWFICKKAGFSPFLSLLNLIPFCVGYAGAGLFPGIRWSPVSRLGVAGHRASRISAVLRRRS